MKTVIVGGVAAGAPTGARLAVHRRRADGTLDGVVELPVTNPTSVAFGGIDGRDLYITTSWFDLESESRTAQPLAGVIFRCHPGVTGPPHRGTWTYRRRRCTTSNRRT